MRNAPGLVQMGMNVASLFLGRDPHEGAETPLHVAISPLLKGVSGQFFYDLVPTHISRVAYDPALAQQLWNHSERIIADGGIVTSSPILVTA